MCEVEGIINDIDLNATIDNYLGARSLSQAGAGFTPQVQQLLEESGLTESPDLLIEFDVIINKAMRVRSERDRIKEDSKKLAKIGARRGGY